MKRKYDVVIVGGGIIGCSASYYLAKRGLSVAVVDKGAVGFEQSTRNWGWIHQQIRYPHIIEFASFSRSLWEGLEAELGATLEWRQGGNFSFASTHSDLAAFEGYRDRAAPMGLESSMLTPSELTGLLPGIGNEIKGALFVPSDGQANPRLVTRAFADAAKKLGVDIIERCAVSGVEMSNGAASGLRTERGLIEGDHVVIAAGAWSRKLLKPLGITIPQTALRSTVIRTAPAAPLTAATGWAHEVAFRQDTRGRFVLAAGIPGTYDVDLDSLRDWREFGRAAWGNRSRLKIRVGRPLLRDLMALGGGFRWQDVRTNEPAPDTSAAEADLTGFQRLFPGYNDLAVEKIWAGNIDALPDQAPVLDGRTGIEGLTISTGFTGHGFAMGPGGGSLTASIVAGEEPPVDLHPCRLTRFADDDLPDLAAFHP